MRHGHGGMGRDLQEPLLTAQKTNPRKRNYLLLTVFLDCVAVLLLYFAMYNWKPADLWSQDVKGYQLGSSCVDFVALALLKLLVCGAAKLLLWLAKSVEVVMSNTVFWVIYSGFILQIGKCLVWAPASPSATKLGAALMIVALLFGALELYVVYHAHKPDPVVEDEEKGKQKPSIGMAAFAQVLKPYFWPRGWANRFRVGVTWACLIGSKATNIFTPLCLGYATEALRCLWFADGTCEGEYQPLSVYKWIGVYCALGFSTVFFKQIQNIVYLGVKQEAYIELSEFTFRHVHSLSLEWHLEKKMGNILRSIDRGVDSADTVVTYLFLNIGPSMVECVIVFSVFFVYFKQPELAAIGFYAVSTYVVITIQITQWRKKFRVSQNKHDNDLHDRATDSLINYETVKYFSNEEFEIERYQQSVRAYQEYSVGSQASLGFLNSLQQLIIQLSMFGVLSVSAYRASQGTMKLGDFVACNGYLLQLYTPLNFLGTIYSAIVQALVDMRNLGELLAVSPDVLDIPGARPLFLKNSTGADEKANVRVEFRNVWFQYPAQRGTDRYALKGINFSVPQGTTTAIVGKTGAGKSTIGRLLFRFYDIDGRDDGAILLDSQNISQVQQRTLRRQIGVVPQDTVLFNETIAYNVKYGRLDATKAQMAHACSDAQILEFIEGLPDKWETAVGERGLKLSGGEKQRVAIARALLKNPPVVLLDEATSALDSITEKSIQQALKLLGESRTTIIIAHRLSTIRHAQQILVLDQGKVVEQGTHDELLALDGRYARMWGEQKVDDELMKATKDSAEPIEFTSSLAPVHD